jgi:CoA:oxalate CoA-transferase
MRPLEGLVVVDVTAAVQGPFANSLLTDLGATVVRITTPAGEIMRRIGPFKRKFPMALLSVARGRAAYVSLDLKSEHGREQLLDLVRRADVFVENWKPGTAARLGLDYESLREINGELVYLSASGFGQTGPLANEGSMDAISAGSSGLSSVSGRPDAQAEKIRVPVLDLTSAMVTTEMALAAILSHAITKHAQRGETSQLEAGTAMVSPLLNVKAEEMLLGGSDRWCTPAAIFRCSDDYIALQVSRDAQWRQLVETLGIESRPEWDSGEWRHAQRWEVEKAVQRALSNRSADQCLQDLKGLGVPATRVRRSVAEALHEPQIADAHIVWRHSERAGWVAIVRPPWDFAALGVTIGQVRSDADLQGDIDWRVLLGEATARNYAG